MWLLDSLRMRARHATGESFVHQRIAATRLESELHDDCCDPGVAAVTGRSAVDSCPGDLRVPESPRPLLPVPRHEWRRPDHAAVRVLPRRISLAPALFLS